MTSLELYSKPKNPGGRGGGSTLTYLSPMKMARKRLSLTQQDLASRIPCSESQIAKIETGRVHNLDTWTKERIASILGIETWEVR